MHVGMHGSWTSLACQTNRTFDPEFTTLRVCVQWCVSASCLRLYYRARTALHRRGEVQYRSRVSPRYRYPQACYHTTSPLSPQVPDPRDSLSSLGDRRRRRARARVRPRAARPLGERTYSVRPGVARTRHGEPTPPGPGRWGVVSAGSGGSGSTTRGGAGAAAPGRASALWHSGLCTLQALASCLRSGHFGST